VRFLALWLCLLALPVQAQSVLETHLRGPGSSGCYLRDYAPAHLAAHPAQQVALIALGPVDWAPPGGWGNGVPDIVLRVAVTLRDGRRAGALAACITAGPQLVCGMEGDQGAFGIEPRAGGAVLLRPLHTGMIFDAGAELIVLSPKAGDDRAFLVPPVPADACP
jgi:hypothetical protein